MYPSPYIKPSLFSMIKNIGWSNILDGTQKTLGVINQAIPIVYQVKPVISNMRNMFKIASVINEPTPTQTTNQNTRTIENKPVFYI